MRVTTPSPRPPRRDDGPDAVRSGLKSEKDYPAPRLVEATRIDGVGTLSDAVAVLVDGHVHEDLEEFQMLLLVPLAGGVPEPLGGATRASLE